MRSLGPTTEIEAIGWAGPSYITLPIATEFGCPGMTL